MIICSHSNIDIIQGVIGYGDAEGITDWRISNTITNANTAILNILNSTSANVRVSVLENGNVGIGTTNPVSMLDIVGDANITGVYKKNNRDVINDTSNYVLSTSNTLVPRILTEVGDGSNYVSRLNTALNTRVDNTSNYVLSTSNLLAQSVSSQWTNVSSGIYYNTANVGIGTTNPISKLHIYDDTISNTKFTIQNNFIPSAPITSSPSATTTGTIGIYAYMVFTYTTETAGAGTGQTLYTINVPTGGVVCDILIVGGGGTGGGDQGGGGGGGGLVYITSENLAAGTYNIYVGRGGTGISVGTNDGNDSSFGNYIAKGGGGGGYYPSVSYGRSGGSGGGGGGIYNVLNATGGSSTQLTYSGRGFGNRGGGASANYSQIYCGGGAGAGEPGVNATNTSAGRGGNGKLINITGQNVYYAGGGGGSIRAGAGVVGGLGGLGGGGNGTQDDITVSNPPNGNPGKNALPNTGGGGGGVSRGEGIPGGSGGSGIVIIRYVISQISSTIELLRGNSTDTNIDYKIGNYSGDFKIISSTSSVDTDYIRITSDGASIYGPTGSPQWSTVSDRRIKENIEKASYDKCYDNINKLELYRFNYIKELKNINKDFKQLGYIAQEVQDIFPKAVSSQEFNNDTLSIADMLSIDITQINYSLYGAVKKLIEICDNKKMRLKNLGYILKNNTSNITIDTSSSNITIDTSSSSNVAMYTISSNVIMDTSSSNITIDTSSSSNVIIDTSSSNVIMDTSSSNVIMDTSSSNITIDTSSSNVIIDTSSSNVIMDTSSSNVIMDTSSSNVIMDTSSSNVIMDTLSSNIVIDT